MKFFYKNVETPSEPCHINLQANIFFAKVSFIKAVSYNIQKKYIMEVHLWQIY
ncbi:hypothetical protein X953_01180 [Virgibacillus sp. SK37]|nr:hypothetical protein X953_01180 [Virgibacillus sp. SK37]